MHIIANKMPEKNICLSKKSSKEDIANLLSIFKNSGSKFEIYDAYYPSASDPGAYICYSGYDYNSGNFNMTLGNHGWSGGIYKVKEDVVLKQLHNLAITQNGIEICIENAVFFSHYEKESFERSEKMNALLLKIHGKKDA